MTTTENQRKKPNQIKFQYSQITKIYFSYTNVLVITSNNKYVVQFRLLGVSLAIWNVWASSYYIITSSKIFIWQICFVSYIGVSSPILRNISISFQLPLHCSIQTKEVLQNPLSSWVQQTFKQLSFRFAHFQLSYFKHPIRIMKLKS